MNDPYKVLNVPSTASDEEIKKAYRELARKYHPDNYHDNPLADLAQEKMKEINEAYELIQKQRKSGASSSGGSSSGSYGSYTAGTASSDPTLRQVRLAISRGDITAAERILNAVSDHNAEWNFLMGVVCSRRGWMDEARTYLETACRMDEHNAEYRRALDALSGQGYRPGGFEVFRTGLFADRDCTTRFCLAWACCNLLGGGGCYFLPCI